MRFSRLLLAPLLLVSACHTARTASTVTPPARSTPLVTPSLANVSPSAVASPPNEMNASANSEPSSHCAAADVAEIERTFLEKPIPIRPGAGTVPFEVTTKSDAARAMFRQGLAYLHDYVWIDAARSFHQALRLDPDLAMAYWGLSRAEGGMHQKPEAKAAIARAKELSTKATPREQRYITLRAQQMDAVAAPPGAEARKMHDDYKAALEAALAADPSDAEMWILRGNAEEPGAWGRGQFGTMGSVAFYESALLRNPHHLGAHHYLVHSLENSGRAAEAVAHARILAAAAPTVPHAQHMLGHVLPRVGRWDEALAMFEKADRLEEAYARDEHLRAGDDWHHTHNLELLGLVYERLGRTRDAEATFRRQLETPIRDATGGGLHAPLVEFYLAQGRYEDALIIARALSKEGTTGPVAGHALEAEALLALGRKDEARTAITMAEGALTAATQAKTTESEMVQTFFGNVVKEARAEVELDGPGAAEADKILTALADEIAADESVDALGGLFTLQRLAAQADRSGHGALAAGMRTRMAKLDPGYAEKKN